MEQYKKSQIINAWSKQIFAESLRQDLYYNELPEQAQQQAILNNQLHNATFGTNHKVNDWIWEYDETNNLVTRKHLYSF